MGLEVHYLFLDFANENFKLAIFPTYSSRHPRMETSDILLTTLLIHYHYHKTDGSSSSSGEWHVQLVEEVVAFAGAFPWPAACVQFHCHPSLFLQHLCRMKPKNWKSKKSQEKHPLIAEQVAKLMKREMMNR